MPAKLTVTKDGSTLSLESKGSISQDGYRAIEDYAVIGDGRSAALVSTDGSIDWLCWPCFDSPSIFASLLGQQEAGSWRISPSEDFRTSRRYIPGTNVLETTFTTSAGSIRLTDFMPVATEEFKNSHLVPDRELIRIVDGLEGEVEIIVNFMPRPQYATVKPDIADKGQLGLRIDARPGSVGLHSPLKYSMCSGRATATAIVHAGERVPFSLTHVTESPAVLPVLDTLSSALQRTIEWWEKWHEQCSYTGPYHEAVSRSALVLKLLHFSPSGAFIAAVTSSLPEKIGGNRNYDYRYCWLRDASLTIHAMCGAGYIREAEAFGEWTLHATRLTQPKLMVMYDVYGNIARPERELGHLPGYKNSQPVRVGNMAREQVQMDIYGEVICGTAKLHHDKNISKMDPESARALISFGRYVRDHWQEPDAGIWEARDKLALHTHSLLLCWVALEELLGMAKKGSLDKVPVQQFEGVRDEIRTYIESKCWDESKESYSSEPGTFTMDATLLLMAYHNFHEASSARMRGTYKRLRSDLDAGGSLLYRYRQDEANGQPAEGAFGICGFWAAEYLAMGGGSLEEAESTFQELVGYANDVGLFAEEIDPETRGARGNFPQAFTHVGLISAALAIETRRKKELQIRNPDELNHEGEC